ncbi:MAG TPA: hypothetical protein VMZ73_00610 [Acidimicrobiales bacterium]|nr:hypothetical protein [Acidimicrobiales bacterium]
MFVMFSKRGERVAEEAAALRVARHPGVVELVDVVGDVLRTRMVDGQPLAALGPMTAAEVAGLAAAVAAIVADLHDLGIVHGGIDASHVLVTTRGRPLLCSLGRGGRPADDVAAVGRLITSLLVQAHPEHGRRRPRSGRPGRRQLGPMLSPPVGPMLATLASEAMALDPGGRPSARALADSVRRLIPSARLPAAATAKQAVRARPTLTPPPALPVPRRLQRSVGKKGRRATVPAEESNRALLWEATPTESAGPPAPVIGAPIPRPVGNDAIMGGPVAQGSARGALGTRAAALRVLTGGLIGFVAVAAVLSAIALAGAHALAQREGPPAAPETMPPHRRNGPSGGPTGGAGGHPASGPAPAGRTVTETRPAPPDPATPDPTTPDPTTPDPTAPAATRVWPVEPAELRGGVVTYRGTRYAIANPGDAAVAGDWGCTGQPTLALLRLDGGHIFAFDDWPSADLIVVARPVGRVRGATALRTVDIDGDGCHELEVARAGTSPVTLRIHQPRHREAGRR